MCVLESNTNMCCDHRTQTAPLSVPSAPTASTAAQCAPVRTQPLAHPSTDPAPVKQVIHLRPRSVKGHGYFLLF